MLFLSWLASYYRRLKFYFHRSENLLSSVLQTVQGSLRGMKLEGNYRHTFSKFLPKCLDLIFFFVTKLTANYTFFTNWENWMATGWHVCCDGDHITACDGTSLRIRHQCCVQPPFDHSWRSQCLCCLLTLSMLSNSNLGYLGLYYLQFQGEILFVICF